MILICLSLNAQRIQFVEQYFPNSSLKGVYCPNSQDDEIGPGGQNTWRIETTPESSTLYLDVVFSYTGIRKSDVYVRGKRSLEMFKHENNTNSIVGFRQARATFKGYTPWANSATGNSRWTGDGDGGIFCEDDNKPDFEGVSGGSGGINSGIFFDMDIQGDTGGSDISADRNCACDTRILKIYWKENIQVAIAPDIDRDGQQDMRYFSDLIVDDDIKAV